MKKSIFTVFVPITEGQEQCERLKQICIDNGLPIWGMDCAFEYTGKENVFSCYRKPLEFSISATKAHCLNKGYTQATEAEFIELLKDYNDGKAIEKAN